MSDSSLGKTLQFVALGLLGLSLVMLILMQFVPWQSQSVSAMGFNVDSTLSLWEVKVDTNMGDQSESLFSDELDGEEGIGMLRAAAILATVALAGTLAAMLMVLFDLRWIAGVVSATATVLLILAVVFQDIGADRFTDGGLDASAGFILGIITAALMAIGTVLAFLPHPGLGVREAMQGLDGKQVDFDSD